MVRHRALPDYKKEAGFNSKICVGSYTKINGRFSKLNIGDQSLHPKREKEHSRCLDSLLKQSEKGKNIQNGISRDQTLFQFFYTMSIGSFLSGEMNVLLAGDLGCLNSVLYGLLSMNLSPLDSFTRRNFTLSMRTPGFMCKVTKIIY